MSAITVADTAKYDSNKRMQKYGALIGVILPFAPMLEYHNIYTENLPQILDNEQAIELCRQESLDKTPLTEDGLQINLSKPEINACADFKIAQSEQARDSFTENHEDNAWKVRALSGAFFAACLAVVGCGYASNRRLRKEKPGIENMKSPGKFDLILR